MRYHYRRDDSDQYNQPHQFQWIPETMTPESLDNVVDWLETVLPEDGSGERWSYAARTGRYVWIRDEPDAVAFRLRWC